MLTLNSYRMLLLMGAASLLTQCAPPPAEAATTFFLDAGQPENYVAVHLNSGHMSFRFSNLNAFAVQIDSVAVQYPFCYGPDCTNAPNPTLQENPVTSLSVTEGSTCGVGAFLQPGESCLVEVEFNLAGRLPDPNADYCGGFFAVVDGHRAEDATVTGVGIQEGFVYVVNPGAGPGERPKLPPALRPQAALQPKRVCTPRWIWLSSSHAALFHCANVHGARAALPRSGNEGGDVRCLEFRS